MRVRVRLHHAFWEGVPGAASGRWHAGQQDLDLSAGATVDELIRQLDIDEHMICMVAVNGRSVDHTTPLADGDSVDLIPPVTGGS